MKRIIHQFILVASLLLVTACGNETNNTKSGMSVAITDAPACGFDHVYVTINRVRVNVSAAAGSNDGGWEDITPATPPKIDLLSLSNGLTLILGQTRMPAASYQQLRLELASNTPAQAVNTIVPSGGSEQPLGTMDMPKDGLTIVSPITISPDRLTEVVLDFDVCRSVVQRGDGSYALRPSISTTQMHVSGGISGYVGATQAGASVYAEINGSIIKGTRADSSGHFVLAPIPASSELGNYDVVIAQDGHATGIITGVPVSAGLSTAVSTQATPVVLPASGMQTASGTALPANTLATLYAKQVLAGNHFFSTRLINANADTGAWVLELASAPPLVAAFGTLPLVFATDSGNAGNYMISAVPVVGTSQNIMADVSGGNVSGVDSTF